MSRACVLFLALLAFAWPQPGSGQFESRDDLSFIVNVVYNPSAGGNNDVEYVGIRGGGLGLELISSAKMVQDAETGVWSYEVRYRSDLKGFYCANCTVDDQGHIPNGDDLKLIFFLKLANSEEEIQMKGSLFRIPLPQSRVSSHFPEKPVHTFYPYFFGAGGIVEVLEVESANEKIGKRRMALYLPPGFAENSKPEYDVYFVLDFSPEVVEKYKDRIDQIFVDGVAHDAVIVGHGDWRYDDQEASDRTVQLTPIEGDDAACNSGCFDNYCNYCIPEVETDEEWFYWMLEGGCGHAIKTGGNADANIDFLLKEVRQAVNTYLADYKSGLTASRDGTFAVGFSHGGIFACHAAWKYSEHFGGASCQSASFWWPYVFEEGANKIDVFSGFHFVNETLKGNLEGRLPQKIIIDVGGKEGDSFYYMLSMSEEVFKEIDEHPMFEANDNLWFQVFPGYYHSTEDWMNRLWATFAILSDGRN